MKRFYLLAAVVGAAVPLYFFSQHFAARGFGLASLLGATFATPAASGFVADLLLSALIGLVFIRRDAGQLGSDKFWLILAGTCLIGFSFGLPLYLYFREAALEKR